MHTHTGFSTALIERYDYSSGTSSRSTKLIHGGVRYLEKAIFHLDIEQYRMVREALHERANLLAIAPHMSRPLPIMLPVYKSVGPFREIGFLAVYKALPPPPPPPPPPPSPPPSPLPQL